MVEHFSSNLESGNRFSAAKFIFQRKENTVPTGKVKWYDTEKGFGFLQTDEGEEVFLHASALPAGTLALKNGTRCEFGVADGKRGMQALSVRVIEAPIATKRKRIRSFLLPDLAHTIPAPMSSGIMAETKNAFPCQIRGP